MRTLLITLIFLAAVAVVGFVGVEAFHEGDPETSLILLVGLLTPVLMGVVNALKADRASAVNKDTNKKVDKLLNGEFKEKIVSLDGRVGNIEGALVEIQTQLSKLMR